MGRRGRQIQCSNMGSDPAGRLHCAPCAPHRRRLSAMTAALQPQVLNCSVSASRNDHPISTANDDPESVLFGGITADNWAPGITKDEAAFFKLHGFLVKPALLQPAEVAAARDRVYAAAPGPLDRSDPDSWIDAPRRWPVLPREPGPSPPEKDYRSYKGGKGVRHPSSYSPEGHVWKWHAEGDSDWLLRLLPNNPAVRGIAAQLLASPLKPTVRVRGVYTLFPTSDPGQTAAAGNAAASTRPATPAKLSGHTDTMAHPLCFMAYLEDAHPRNGGFTVWPGSHVRMFRAHHQRTNWSPIDEPSIAYSPLNPGKGGGGRIYKNALATCIREITPFELAAPAGTVIFWHGRLVHSAGIHTGKHIRMSVPGEWQVHKPLLSANAHGDAFFWFHDGRLYAEDPPPGDDMWEGEWSSFLRSA